LLAWIITTTMTFEDAVPTTEKFTLPVDPISSLQTPLLQGGSSSSTPCSIRTSIKGAGTENQGITDLEAEEPADNSEIESAEPAAVQTYNNEVHSVWQMLGHAMVGRWGSIRPSRLPSLQ